MAFLKPISISLSPNTEKDDILLVLKLIFQFWFWTPPIHHPRGPNGSLGGRRNSWSPTFGEPLPSTQSSAVQELEEEFKKYLGIKYAISFNSGRSALMAILEALNIKDSDEILLQAFTCNSAVIPILKQKAKPIYVDIDQTLNLDPEDLKKKITPQSKVVMIQHTFGWPAKIDEILEICKKNNLFLIEDCAHSLGAKYLPLHQDSGGGVKRFCGTFGDVAFFSFGRDKIISSIFGGMAVTNNEEIGERIKNFQEKLGFPSNFWTFQQLLHPILTNYLILPVYGLSPNFGKFLLNCFHQFSILSKAIYKKEKKGEVPKYFPKRLPNALAILALNQFKKLEKFNNHRREIAKFYEKELKNQKFILPLAKFQSNIVPTSLRYSVLTNLDTDKILKEARKRKIYLDDGWRKSPIVPLDTDIEKMKYISGNCPKAEKISQTIVNLPTHINISKKDAQKITYFLKNIRD